MEADPPSGERWIVVVQGRLDVSSRRHMAEMAAILTGLGRDVEFDLSGVTCIDAAGWAGLTDALDTLRSAGVSARVSAVGDPGGCTDGVLHPPFPTCAA